MSSALRGYLLSVDLPTVLPILLPLYFPDTQLQLDFEREPGTVDGVTISVTVVAGDSELSWTAECFANDFVRLAGAVGHPAVNERSLRESDAACLRDNLLVEGLRGQMSHNHTHLSVGDGSGYSADAWCFPKYVDPFVDIALAPKGGALLVRVRGQLLNDPIPYGEDPDTYWDHRETESEPLTSFVYQLDAAEVLSFVAGRCALRQTLDAAHSHRAR